MSGWWARRSRGGRRAAGDLGRLNPALERQVEAAYFHGAPIPEDLARQAAEAGSREAMVVYGIGLANRSAFPEAERWLERARAAGDPMASVALGTIRMDQGDFDEAERYFRPVAETGNAGARQALDELRALRAAAASSTARPVPEPARPAEPVAAPSAAEWAQMQLLLHPDEHSHPHVQLAMALLEAEEGHFDEARTWFAAAVRSGDPDVLFWISQTHVAQDGLQGAEEYIRGAADAGHPVARHTMGHLLAERGEPAEAERYYRLAADAGHTDSLVNLGVLLRQRGDLDGAEKCYRQAIKAGDTDAMNNLGNLLRQRGDLGAAEQWWRQAADAGNGDALASYGALHTERGDWERAEELFRKSAQAGNAAGMLNLAHVLVRTNRVQEAETWLRTAGETKAPEPEPEPEPASDGPDLRAVAAWLSGPAEAGDTDALAALDLLGEADNPS